MTALVRIALSRPYTFVVLALLLLIIGPLAARPDAPVAFETLEKLLKIASLIQALKLPGSQLDWLFRENPWLATAPDPQAKSCRELALKRQLARVRYWLSAYRAALGRWSRW